MNLAVQDNQKPNNLLSLAIIGKDYNQNSLILDIYDITT